MLVLKTKLNAAERAKRKIIEQNALALDYTIEKDDEYIYFPLKEKEYFNEIELKDDDFAFIDCEMRKKKMPPTRDLRKLLEGKLSIEEFEKLKTSYDTVGNIAILEIDDDLRKYEKIIAEALLESNKNIKTVLRKDEKHEGEFRTQKMKWLAGIKTKETIHKENGVLLQLDVETVYFSPRLSTDRKRIMQQVKEGEDILVMFSGCAPYPCVFAKNTKARTIVGIEINPEGYRYGLKNLELNKLKNVVLINGDVNKEVPRIYKHILGLKSSIDEDELTRRLMEKPLMMEFHLFKRDLFENRYALEKIIQEFKKKNIQVIMHMPFPEKENHWLGGKTIDESLVVLKVLGDICKTYDVKAVVHVTWGKPEISDEEIANNIKKLKEYYDYFYFENGIESYSTTDQILRISKYAGIKNVCIDTAHLYIVYKNNEKIIHHINAMRENFNTYFHLSDSDGIGEGMLIDSGDVDIERILAYVLRGIVEVRSKDEKNPIEMIGSYREIISEQKKFNRILMPLPKSAGDFLDTALLAAKKGTIIHFYNFLREDNFTEAERIVDAACKRAGRTWRKIAFVKCGQHAPRTFRICLDFEVLN